MQGVPRCFVFLCSRVGYDDVTQCQSVVGGGMVELHATFIWCTRWPSHDGRRGEYVCLLFKLNLCTPNVVFTEKVHPWRVPMMFCLPWSLNVSPSSFIPMDAHLGMLGSHQESWNHLRVVPCVPLCWALDGSSLLSTFVGQTPFLERW